MLEKLGYYNGEINGQMNDRMRQAIIAFQKGFGLVADGIIWAQTRAAMEQALEDWQKVEGEKVSQEVPEMWRELARSVCKIVLPDGKHGTGFLVAGDYIITANFVLPNVETVQKAEAHFYHPDWKDTFILKLNDKDFITNEGDIAFTKVKFDSSQGTHYRTFFLEPLSLSVELPRNEEKLSLIFFQQEREINPNFLLNKPISSVHQFDILFDAPEIEPGAGGAPIFNERGEVVAIYDSIVDYMDLRKGVLMKEVMWYINASQGNRFEFWRGLIERGFTANVLVKMQAEYPDMSELKGYSEEYQKITAELKDGKLPHGEFERLFNNIGYRLNGLINLLESRGNQSSYAA